jgi:hypothetical protein
MRMAQPDSATYVYLSRDDGKTCGKRFRATYSEGDIGYPSSVELLYGQVLTAYYASWIAGQNLYHMGVVTWDPLKTIKP